MIGIVNMGGGNLGSISQAIYSVGCDYRILTKIEDFDNEIGGVILPGVGAYDATMMHLNNTGLSLGIKNFATTGKPILGICVGMQVLSDFGNEGSGSTGLGLIAGEVKKLPVSNKVPLPHVGWNEVTQKVHHNLFKGIKSGIDFYFVNSYCFIPKNSTTVIAETNYEVDFCSAIGDDNIFGVQFHPEKSQKNGLRLLENFCEMSFI